MGIDAGKVFFVGSFSYSLDSKDRLNIPAKFRKVLPHEANDSFVITKGFENCLHLYPSNLWHEFVHRYWELFYSNQVEYRKFAIWCYRDTYESQIDKQGRIQIPKVLLAYAKLEKEIMIIGYNSRIELWNPDLCNEFVGADDEKYMRMAVEFTSGAPIKQQQNPQNTSPIPPQGYNYPPPPPNYYANPYLTHYNPYPPPNHPGVYPGNPNVPPVNYPGDPNSAHQPPNSTPPIQPGQQFPPGFSGFKPQRPENDNTKSD